jgi:toxin ParE1/3/4
MLQIKWLRKAEQNLEAAYNYLNEENPIAAQKFIQEVYELTNLLRTAPAMGRNGRVAGTRELVLAHFPYLLPYRVWGEQIQILRVFNTNKKPPLSW